METWLSFIQVSAWQAQECGCGAWSPHFEKSPTSYWKSLAPDRSDDEHDPLDTSRPRYSHSNLSDSDTEAKLTETNA
ncbi:Unconventional myosin-XVIIIa [Plecturocebus cupreus]